MTVTKNQIDSLMREAKNSTITEMPSNVVRTIFFEKLKKNYPDFWVLVSQIANNSVRQKTKATSNGRPRFWHWIEFQEIPEFKQVKYFTHRPTRQDILMLAVYAKVDPNFQG